MTLAVAAVAVAALAAPLKLATLGFTQVGLSDAQAEFYAEHLSSRLAEDASVRVVTRKDLTPQQLELLTCCLAQLAESLDAGGLITGNVTKVDGYQTLNVKIVAADGTATLFAYRSQPLANDQAVLAELDKLARRALNSLGDAGPDAVPREPAPSSDGRSLFKLAPSLLGVGGLVGGALFLFQAQSDYSLLKGSATLAMPEQTRNDGKSNLGLGLSLAIVGVVLIAASILWYAFG